MEMEVDSRRLRSPLPRSALSSTSTSKLSFGWYII